MGNILKDQRKRRNHYIWQKYLEPWVSCGRIFCKIDDSIKNINPVNLGVEKDFYELKKLSANDITVVYNIFIKDLPDELKELNNTWINLYTFVHKVKDTLGNNVDEDEKISRVINVAVSNLEEYHQNRVENIGSKYLRQLYNLDASFFLDDTGYSEFMFYLCTQYTRTKKRKETVKERVKGFEGINIENIWNLGMHIIVTNMCASMFLQKEKTQIRLLRNTRTTELITSDQPVINTYATHIEPNVAPDKLEFYYPLSPNLAVAVKPNENDRRIITENLTDSNVIAYNNAIAIQSYKQLYAKSETSLLQY